MPTKLGKYEIEGELGKGAMGVVYRARDSRLGRPVALKTMTSEVASNPDLLKRFYREAQSAGQLRHPNIVTIYDIDEDDGVPFIAMEFLEGSNLEQIISARQDMPIVKKLDIIAQACRGLHHAHEAGIVHRDIKPGNIVVLTDGMVKLVDFGIARIGGTSVTQTGMVLGTVMYMSPEQVRAQQVDARSDVFSMGIVLYELLTYQTPFPGNDVPSILFKILNDPPNPISKVLPNCPPRLEQILARALEKDREQRYQSAEDLAFELQGIGEHLKHDMVEVYLSEGQRSLESENFTVAKESLQKVLEIDSSHGVAKSLLAQVQEQLYTRQRAQKVEQNLRQAKQALMDEQFDEALHHLEEILTLDPEHKEANQYKQMAVERKERRQKLARHLERAEKYTADADFQAAKAELEAVLKVDRSNSAALRMMDWVEKELTEQERLRQVRQFTQTARAQLAEKNYDKALELLEKARALDPINIEVDSLTRLVRSTQEKEERRQQLTHHLDDIHQALNLEHYDQALALANKVLEDFPDDPQVLKLHAQAVRRADIHKRRKYVDEQLAAAKDFMEKNQPSSAAAVLERALETFPDDTRLSTFLRTVHEAQERAGVEAIRQEAVQQANEKIREKDFAAAMEILEAALARAGQSPQLNDLLQFTREQQAIEQRESRLREVLARAQTCLREDNFDEAIAILERAQRELKAEQITELLATARKQREKYQEREAEQRRRDRINQILAEAKAALKEQNFAEAVLVLEQGQRDLPAPEIESLLARARKQQQEFQKRQAEEKRLERIQQVLTRAKASLKEENFDEAVVVLEGGARELEAPEITSLLATARQQQQEYQKRRAQEEKQERIRQVVRQAQNFLREENFRDAVRVLERGSQELKTEEVAALLAQAREQQEKFERGREEIMGQARQLLQQGEATKAVALLDTAPKPYFKNEAFQTLYAQCRKDVDRAKFVQSAVTEIEKNLAAEQWEQAEAAVLHALKTYADDRTLLNLKQRVEQERRRALERKGRKVLEDAKVAMGRMQFEQMMALIQSFPWESAKLPELTAEADKLLEEARRRAEEEKKRRPTFKPPVIPAKAREAAAMPVARPAPAKGIPMAIWAAAGVVVLALAAVALYRMVGTGPSIPGHLQLSAVPWAEVVSVQTAKGAAVEVPLGQTPLQFELPPGEYVIELKNGEMTDRVNVTVVAGQVQAVNHPFPQVKIDALVDELVSQY